MEAQRDERPAWDHTAQKDPAERQQAGQRSVGALGVEPPTGGELCEILEVGHWPVLFLPWCCGWGLRIPPCRAQIPSRLGVASQDHGWEWDTKLATHSVAVLEACVFCRMKSGRGPTTYLHTPPAGCRNSNISALGVPQGFRLTVASQYFPVKDRGEVEGASFSRVWSLVATAQCAPMVAPLHHVWDWGKQTRSQWSDP